MQTSSKISVTSDRRDAAAVDRILRSLPDWFGIESAIQEYVEAAETHQNYLALVDEQVVGVVVLTRHFPEAAEVHLIAVDPAHHRFGIGTQLLSAVEVDLRAQGVRFLQVKTLGASHPSEHYACTREFYFARGFVPLEELTDLWPGNPCLLMVKML